MFECQFECQCEKPVESHVTYSRESRHILQHTGMSVVKSITVPVPPVICYLYRRITVSMKFLEMPRFVPLAATAATAVHRIDSAASRLLLEHVNAVKLVVVHYGRRENVGEVVPGLEAIIELKHLGLNGTVGR